MTSGRASKRKLTASVFTSRSGGIVSRKRYHSKLNVKAKPHVKSLKKMRLSKAEESMKANVSISALLADENLW
jgi:hypothetical protein